ncbi:MAG: tetratricopeptide repeat protein [Phycisphaerales bacterium]|nr:tetratricopeptide repeat protein [Phycisphaerales bacterium]
MAQLVIRHEQGAGTHADPASFRVQLIDDGGVQDTDPMVLPAPPDSLIGSNAKGARDLRWYLERYLERPFDVDTAQANRVLGELAAWGTSAFNALFGSGAGRDRYRDAMGPQKQFPQVELKISTDSPTIAAWPWEALLDTQLGASGYLAFHCRITRALNLQTPSTPIPDELKRHDKLHVLLVTARPDGDRDVAYRTVSRPLIDLVHADPSIPAEITVLRPPTVDGLKQHLLDRPGHYHVLHFDGHGVYANLSQSGGGGTAAGPQFDPHRFGAGAGSKGYLVFENESGTADLIAADVLSTLVREHQIPVVVLNACQSAMIDDRAQDAFASVAGALIQGGVLGVVAMSYSLWVSGATVFLPAFYRELFRARELSQAVRAGRVQMMQDRGRVSPRGKSNLDDWLVPVVYQQRTVKLTLAASAPADTPVMRVEEQDSLPETFAAKLNPYGLIGRDGPILEIERAMRRSPAAILIWGMAGAGKTTLARGLVRWLAETGGLPGDAPPLWISFEQSQTPESVLHGIGEAIYGKGFVPGAFGEFQRLKGAGKPVTERHVNIALIRQGLEQAPRLIVWDNFETVRGFEEESARMSASDQQTMLDLLEALRGGKSKVIITSRSREDWIPGRNCYRLSAPLGGLRGEERWDFCEKILKDLGLAVDRDDPVLTDLLYELDGHPLMMSVILPRVVQVGAKQTLEELLRRTAPTTPSEDSHTARLNLRLAATMKLAEDALPANLKPLLGALAFLNQWVHAETLRRIGQNTDRVKWTHATIDRFLGILSKAGLLQQRANDLYEPHPALGRHLRSVFLASLDQAQRDAWGKAAVEVLAGLCDGSTAEQLDRQTLIFETHKASFELAIAEADRLGKSDSACAIEQAMGLFAVNIGQLDEAECRYRSLAARCTKPGAERHLAAAYHQLGLISGQRRDFVQAEDSYYQSLKISEQIGDKQGMAGTFLQLGIIAQERRDFDEAQTWYRKAVAVFEMVGPDRHAAAAYHQLGNIDYLRRDFDAAEAWYRKCLTIDERIDNQHDAARTYHQLGNIAQERQDLDDAEAWYRKAIAVFARLGAERDAAAVYHQLGIIAQIGCEMERAEAWYRQSLDIKERLGDKQGAAATYHQLGRVAEQRGDFNQAESWYRKSLEVEVQNRNQYGAALTQGQLGLLESTRGNFTASGEWTIKASLSFINVNHQHAARQAARNYARLLQRCSADERGILLANWKMAGLPDLPEL